MTSTIKALAIAATLALPLAAPTVAQENAGSSMLMSQVANELSRMGFTDVDTSNLTLSQLVEIEGVLKNNDMGGGDKSDRIELILTGD